MHSDECSWNTHTHINHSDWPHLKLMTMNPRQVGYESGQSCHISLVQLFLVKMTVSTPLFSFLIFFSQWKSFKFTLKVETVKLEFWKSLLYKYPISPTNVYPLLHFHRYAILSFKIISPSIYSRNLFLHDQWYIFNNSTCYLISPIFVLII